MAVHKWRSLSIANVTEYDDQYVSFQSDPNGRGTASLVLSCLLTLILCVWSALHLNVPQQKQSRLQHIWLNLRWIITGIYAPELVVFAAWRQWSSARLLSAHVEQHAKLKDEKPVPWSSVHSFFACSGGFALEPRTFSQYLASPGTEDQACERLVLTARGVALLAQLGLLPHVTKEEIQDKSKANDLAKATTLIQATWMMLQCIGRLLAKLPVTLLEVNTVAHVLCTLLMYLFWWDKPLLPNEPIVLRSDDITAIAHFMHASSEMSGCIDPANFRSETLIKTLVAQLNLYSKSPRLEFLAFRRSFGIDEDDGSVNGIRQIRAIEAPEECLRLLRGHKGKEAATAFFERRPRLVPPRKASPEVTSEEQNGSSAVLQALLRFPGLFEQRVLFQHRVDDHDCIHLRPEQLVGNRIQNWPGDDLMRNVDGLVVGMILWLANFCYGGIHAAAWNDHFPSKVEQWIWRISACYIGFCGGLWLALNFIVARTPKLNEFWERWMDGEKTWWQNVGLGLLVFVCGFSLVVVRTFIVVEAFISIRELPVLAYQTPNWTDIFPHL